MLPIISAAIVVLALIMVLSLAYVKKGNSAAKRVKVKNREQILKEANRRLASNPKDRRALSALGEMAWSDQNWEQAAKYYGTLSALGPGSSPVNLFEIHSRLGISLLKTNHPNEAYKALVAARSFRHEDFEVNFNLGCLEYQRRSYEKAVSLLRMAVKENSEHAEAQRFLGLSCLRVKAYKDAVQALRKAIDLNPDDKEALFAAAECYYELGAKDQAVKIFSHLRADPVFGPSASLFAGTIHLNQHLYDRAIMDFEIGLKHQNAKPETMLELKYRLAAAQLKLQDIAKAVATLTEINSIAPNYKDVPALLANYRELNSNTNLQTFLLGVMSEFVNLCKKIVHLFFPHAHIKITDVAVQGNDWADILAEVETPKWQDMVLFRFIRSQGTVGELALRDLHARIKELKVGRGFCVTSGVFSEEARRFVEARFIDLVEKQELVKLLHTINAAPKGLSIE